MLQMVSNKLHMHVQMQAHAHIYAHTCKHIIDINHNFYKIRNAKSPANVKHDSHQQAHHNEHTQETYIVNIVGFD